MKTIGDHLRKVRLDRDLSQPQVAKIIGVIPDTICIWELNQNEPIEHHFPAIFKFLGYNPIVPEAKTLGQKIKKMRLENGWTLQQAKDRLGFEIPTIRRVEADSIKVQKSTWKRVSEIVNSR